MSKIRTHYDNLKVVRNAPDEVIRAAYKTLTQKYHPDRNPGDAKAARVMSLLNVSYGVLSEPAKRRAHDDWIARAEKEERRIQEVGNAEDQQTVPAHSPASPSASASAPSSFSPSARKPARSSIGSILIFIGIFSAFAGYLEFKSTNHASSEVLEKHDMLSSAHDGPSYDCSRAKKPAALAICNSAVLSQMDREMAELYVARLAIDPKERVAQREWLRERNVRCSANVPCLITLYKKRIELLANTQS